MIEVMMTEVIEDDDRGNDGGDGGVHCSLPFSSMPLTNHS